MTDIVESIIYLPKTIVKKEIEKKKRDNLSSLHTPANRLLFNQTQKYIKKKKEIRSFFFL